MIKIIPNIINKKEQNLLNKKIQDNNFPWYYYDNVIEGRDNNYKKYKNITETYAWVHSLFLLPNGVNSSYFDDFKIILSEFEKKEKIKIKELLRIRIRKTFYCKGHNLKKYNFPHVDLCNLTIDKRNTPVKGNAVYFDGDIFHAGNCPVNYNTRTVLNFDFKINESV